LPTSGEAAANLNGPSERKSKISAVFRVSIGNFLEMYDFMVFGYYASGIARTFFPRNSAYASLMLAFATFGSGYLMRPLGAILLGAYVDRRGRRAGLLLTLTLMAIGTLTIGCIPGYETLGLLAPLIVVAGRLVQGFSAGVEIGGVSVYLAEIATPGRKGFYVAWQSASQQIAVIFAALLGLILADILPPVQMLAWGWRIPLLIGSMLIPFVFLLRRSLTETAEFLARRHRPTTREIWRTMAANWQLVVLGMLLSTTTTVTFYLITAYTPTFGSRVLHLSSSDSMIVTLCVGICNFICLPLSGALSDGIGRRPLLILFSVSALVTAYPALFWLTAQPSFGRLLAVELWFSVIFGGYNGAMVVFLTEIMPAQVRTSGFSLAYSLATGIFGGFTPAISTYLIHRTGNPAMPGVWLAMAGAMGLFATTVLSSRRSAAETAESVTSTVA
jgi:MFS transporter, MHS family, citrate/tricarballylate:H+ symporter